MGYKIIIMDNRMFDFAAFYDKMALEVPHECKIVEVGVSEGASSLYLANKLKEFGKAFELYMVDSLAYGGKKQLYEIIKNVINSSFANQIEIMPEDSLNASCKFNDNSLDMVFLDSSHDYSQTKAEILLWQRKVKSGGYVCGHDYFSEENPGVRMAVDEIIPKEITREPILSQEQYFEPEQLLFTEQTEKGNGVWYFKNMFYTRLNPQYV